jgi:hypothetical protein
MRTSGHPWSPRAVCVVLLSWLWPLLVLVATMMAPLPRSCALDWGCGPDWTYAQFFLWLAITLVPPTAITYLALFRRARHSEGAA